MIDKKTVLIHYYEELKKLKKEVEDYNQYNEYFIVSAMNTYMDRYNRLRDKYFKTMGIPLEKMAIYEYEYSSTRKTVNSNCINRLLASVTSTLGLVDNMLTTEKNKEVRTVIPDHQMRTCLKIGVDGCPLNPELVKGKVFVGLPFNDKHVDSYEFGIKIALESSGLSHFKANDRIENKDIMCKICKEMQEAEYHIFNISDLNPNVMLELGLSYGLGKETIVIKDKDTRNISDLSNTEYIEYAHAVDLRDKLISYFDK